MSDPGPIELNPLINFKHNHPYGKDFSIVKTPVTLESESQESVDPKEESALDFALQSEQTLGESESEESVTPTVNSENGDSSDSNDSPEKLAVETTDELPTQTSSQVTKSGKVEPPAPASLPTKD